MLLKKEPKPEVYRFRRSNSIIKVAEYMLKCMIDGVAFDASDVNSTILDSALIRVSKATGYSILVASDVLEKVLRMTYGYKEIYSPKTIPSYVYHVICLGYYSKKEMAGKEVMLNVLLGPKK
jgi:hypothetical protein